MYTQECVVNLKVRRSHSKEEKNIVGRIIGNCYRIFVPGWI
jgi:hypothetical protein